MISGDTLLHSRRSGSVLGQNEPGSRYRENAMKLRNVVTILCVGLLAGIVWLAGRGGADGKPTDPWTEIMPGVLRSPGLPAGYALLTGDRALLIDAPCPPDGLK